MFHNIVDAARNSTKGINLKDYRGCCTGEPACQYCCPEVHEYARRRIFSLRGFECFVIAEQLPRHSRRTQSSGHKSSLALVAGFLATAHPLHDLSALALAAHLGPLGEAAHARHFLNVHDSTC